MSRRSPLGAIETVTEDLPPRRHPGRTTVGFIVAGGLHLAVFLVLFRSSPEVQALRQAIPVAVHLHRTAPKPQSSPRREPAAAKTAPAAPAPSGAASRVITPTPRPPPPHLPQHPAPLLAPAPMLPASPVVDSADLTPGELAGARTAGEGEGGGGTGGAGGGGSGAGRGAGCSMLARLQSALRRNAKVQAAAAARANERPGRPIVVWRGGWVQSAGEDGKGLAGVRQAITLEIAFAPEACKTETLHGFVLIPLAAGPAAPRLALGAANWRWSDLLEARRGG